MIVPSLSLDAGLPPDRRRAIDRFRLGAAVARVGSPRAKRKRRLSSRDAAESLLTGRCLHSVNHGNDQAPATTSPLRHVADITASTLTSEIRFPSARRIPICDGTGHSYLPIALRARQSRELESSQRCYESAAGQHLTF